MSITSCIDRVRNLTIFTVRGDITAEELQTAVKKFWESSTLTLNVLWDVREATFTHMKYKEMDEILFHVDSYTDRFEEIKSGKTAVVVNSDEQFAVLKQLSSHASIECLPIIPEVFKTMGEAMAWIDQTEYDYITAMKGDRDPTPER
jgi:protein-arginine kinase